MYIICGLCLRNNNRSVVFFWNVYFLQGVYPTTAEKFFDLLLSDSSNFTNEYRAARKDSHLTVSCRLSHPSCIHQYLLLIVSHSCGQVCCCMIHSGTSLMEAWVLLCTFEDYFYKNELLQYLERNKPSNWLHSKSCDLRPVMEWYCLAEASELTKIIIFFLWPIYGEIYPSYLYSMQCIDDF